MTDKSEISYSNKIVYKKNKIGPENNKALTQVCYIMVFPQKANNTAATMIYKINYDGSIASPMCPKNAFLSVSFLNISSIFYDTSYLYISTNP